MNIIDLFRKGKANQPQPQELLCMDGMAERNAARIKAIKDEMGEKWILHPAHMKHKLEEPRPV
jgi:hypothetical protein